MSVKLGQEPFIRPGAEVTNSHLGQHTEAGKGCVFLDSEFRYYLYICCFEDVAYARIGKFVSNLGLIILLWRASQHHFFIP